MYYPESESAENVETIAVETLETESEEATDTKVTVYTDATVAGKQASPLADYQFDFGTKAGNAGDPFKTITNQAYSEEAGYYNATYANNKISVSVNGAEFEEVGIPAYAVRPFMGATQIVRG